MTQADFTIANQTFPNTRAEINTSLQALATNSAGNSAPSTTFASQWWFDSDGDQLYIRNKDNDAWVKVFKIGATSDLITELATDSITIAGSTPTLTIGDGGAEDTKIVFDGNAQNFYIGLDDSADDLLIGLGSTVGTTPAIAIDENNLVTLPDGHMVISSTAAGDNLTLISTNAGAEAGPQLVLYRNSASPANNDVIGRMRFEGEDNEGNKTVYAQLTSQIIDKGSSGGEDSTFQMEVFNNGAVRDIFTVAGSTGGTPTIIFNDSSQNVDFRVESDSQSNMFFIQAAHASNSAGTIGFNSANSDGNFIEAVNPQTGVYTAKFINSNSSGNWYNLNLHFSSAAPDDNGNLFISASDNSSGRFQVFADGDVRNHDNSYGSISDERIKQDIRDSNSQWDDIKAIKVRNFKKKDDVRQYGDNAWEQIGVVAQELETVSPKLIKHNNPEASDILSDSSFGTLYEDGDDIPEGKEIGDVKEIKEQVKSVNYSIIYMKAIKALQEAQTRIETLETKVSALEG